MVCFSPSYRLAISGSRWDLGAPTKDGTSTPALGAWSLNHGTSKEVPIFSVSSVLLLSSRLSDGTSHPVTYTGDMCDYFMTSFPSHLDQFCQWSREFYPQYMLMCFTFLHSTFQNLLRVPIISCLTVGALS